MNAYLNTTIPTIYADMNIFRYVACGDISIHEAGRFIWVFSHVHFDEIHRNGNTDALKGMAILNEVEITDVLDFNFHSVGNVVLQKYVDPYLRYQQHLEAINGFEDKGDHIIELLMRIYGADNFAELSLTPGQLRIEIDSLIDKIDPEVYARTREKALDVSDQMQAAINLHLSERLPIDKTRLSLGITSEIRREIQELESPIDEIWNLISPSVKGINKNQFLGFEPLPGVEGVERTQHGSIASSQAVLNLLGVSPDKGLASRKKIRNILSDGQHVGMASYCSGLLSADRKFCNKAQMTYTYLGNVTRVLGFEFVKGMQVNIHEGQLET